ncbi:unnamed protein product [Didymodactylos carnosus]|uniref:B30.2/SPRY domain-containing protein n=1 Tax=Didymodactylos carnosus TaxID=1234261 RepID=A0A814AH88_9BILA|nr:unnamed protein product [Didymodactylos carnosus]CAF0937906.1 unnamed protein product [Didymodactylos carnosus]CAF3695260.1 unnamed protein product [Didymodactylos carnosus]CAF3713437.1 unnamed protein product [Didymodactylos carnosus]
MAYKSPCIKCQKGNSILTCSGCQKMFCRKCTNEHRLELNTQLDRVVYEHDLIQQQLQVKDHSSYNFLFNQINKWQTESINKVKQAGDEARQNIRRLLDQNKDQLTKDLRKLIDELRKSKKSENYVETDLDKWKLELQKLKEELQMASNIRLETQNSSWIDVIKVVPRSTTDDQELQLLHHSPHTATLTHSPTFDKPTPRRENEFATDLSTTLIERDTFDAAKTYGPVKIQDNGKVAVHAGSTDSATEIRGAHLYSTGKHFIQLKLEKMHHGYSLFGLISSSIPVQETSISSKATYGWVPGKSKQAWLKGSGSSEYGGYDGDVVENDVIGLLLNCDKKTIQLSTKRTNKLYQIPIDVHSCPFPWQLYLSLYEVGDIVRIV